MPLATTPGLTDVGGHLVDHDLREGTSLGVVIEMVRWVIPDKAWVKD